MIRTLEEIRRNRVSLWGIDVSAVTKKLGDHSTEICRHFDELEALLRQNNEIQTQILSALSGIRMQLEEPRGR